MFANPKGILKSLREVWKRFEKSSRDERKKISIFDSG
jgi:hypothetical protein